MHRATAIRAFQYNIGFLKPGRDVATPEPHDGAHIAWTTVRLAVRIMHFSAMHRRFVRLGDRTGWPDKRRSRIHRLQRIDGRGKRFIGNIHQRRCILCNGSARSEHDSNRLSQKYNSADSE